MHKAIDDSMASNNLWENICSCMKTVKVLPLKNFAVYSIFAYRVDIKVVGHLVKINEVDIVIDNYCIATKILSKKFLFK